MNKIKAFLASPLGQSLVHALKVAGFLAITAFLTSLAGFLAKDQGIANFIALHPYAALVFSAINMFIAGLLKYTQVK